MRKTHFFCISNRGTCNQCPIKSTVSLQKKEMMQNTATRLFGRHYSDLKQKVTSGNADWKLSKLLSQFDFGQKRLKFKRLDK